MNKKIIRILMLEDNQADADLVQFELREASIDFIAKIVMSENDFIHELRNFSPDVILSDYDLPQYNGALALAEAKKRCPDVPFILVTGAITEDRAIDILTGGAKDYVMKNRLNRLGPALFRALDEADEHRARKMAEQELRTAHRNLEKQIAEKTADLSKYSNRLEILSWTAGRLLESDNPQEIVEELCRRVMKFLDCDAFFNFLVDENAGRLHLNACAGIPDETARTIEWLDYGVAVCGCAARDALRIVAENIQEKPDIRTELVKSFGIKAYACHPLMQRSKVIGTLSFGTSSRTTFSEEDLAMMKAVADQVAIAMARINTEKALRITLAKAEESERSLKALMENVPEGITIADAPDARIKMVSKYGQEIIGGAHDGMTAQEVVDVWNVFDKDGKTPVHVEDLPLTRAISKGETVINKEIVQVNSKGKSVPLLCNAAPIRDSSGKIISGIVAWRDISERKQTEKELEMAHRRLDALVSSVHNGILLVSEDGVKLANQAFCDYFELPDSPHDLIGLSPSQMLEKIKSVYLHPEKEMIHIREIIERGQPVIGEEVAMKNGIRLRDFIPVYMDQKQYGRLWSHTDITTLRRIEEELRKSEARFRSVLDHTMDCIYRCNLQTGRFEYISPSVTSIVGYTPDELMALDIESSEAMVHPDDLPQMREAMVSLKDIGRKKIEYRQRTKSGDYCWISNHISLTRDKNGLPLYREGNIRDITEDKKREEQLNRLNRTLQAMRKGSQAMMRATNEQAYMDDVCRIIVEDCGHIMCWIGLAEEDMQKSVRPVACAGAEKGYLKTVNITWADTEQGCGPTGMAIRTGKPSMCRNVISDPLFTPWREEAVKRGYASSLVLPLISLNRVFGALNIYFGEPDPFKEDEVRLLTELADDLAYGITTIRLRLAHAEAETALKESEKYYRSLFENMSDGFILNEVMCNKFGVPNDYRFIDINPAFERLSGLKRKDIIRKTFTEVFPKENLQIERYNQLALTGEPIHFEISSRRGRQYEVIAYITAPLRFAAIFRDVTERKHAEKELRGREQLLKDVINGSTSPICLKDVDGKFITINSSLERMLGISRDEIKGKTDYDIASREAAEGWRANDQRVMKSGKAIQVEEVADLKDGYHIFLANKFPLVDNEGNVYGVGSISHDITDRKNTERALAEKTKELEYANKELESFSYSVSHDLRAPLRAIDGYAKIILRKQREKFEEETIRHFNQIRKSAKAMSQLIDDLLSFSRLGQQTINAKSFNMRYLIEKTWQELKSANPDRNMILEIKPIPIAWGDKALIKQVLVNLFSNAVKFTKNRDIAVIEIGGSKEENEIVYYIKDNGVGFDMHYKDKLFGVFQRLHSMSEYEGTGIGLALVQRVIYRHGGRVWSEGKIDEGATFYFSLPSHAQKI